MRERRSCRRERFDCASVSLIMDSVNAVQMPVTWLLTFAALMFSQSVVVITIAVKISSRWASLEAKIAAIEKNETETSRWVSEFRAHTRSARDEITAVRLALELLLDGVPPSVVREAMNRTNEAMGSSR